LEITSFVVENVSVPEEVEQAIDKRSSMSAVGNLNDYVRFQMAQSLTSPGQHSTGVASELAIGMAMAQQLVQQQQQAPGSLSPLAPAPHAAPPTPPSPPPFPDLLSPGEAAQLLGVSEGDVLATIQSGDLKAKKIGSTFRITRSALDDFLKS
jgi:excisionase family DNA binding protein